MRTTIISAGLLAVVALSAGCASFEAGYKQGLNPSPGKATVTTMNTLAPPPSASDTTTPSHAPTSPPTTTAPVTSPPTTSVAPPATTPKPPSNKYGIAARPGKPGIYINGLDIDPGQYRLDAIDKDKKIWVGYCLDIYCLDDNPGKSLLGQKQQEGPVRLTLNKNSAPVLALRNATIAPCNAKGVDCE